MMEIATLAPSRTRFNISLPLVFGLLVYSLLIYLGAALLADPDIYSHIAIGRWIIANGTVPDHDVFSFTMPGAPWVPFEWLAEVVFASLYDHFGWAGLVMATAFCIAAALAILLRALLYVLIPVHALIATVLAWFLVLFHMLARPHILILPILVVWVAALVRARAEDRAPSPWMAPLIALWANLHASYMFGLGLAALLAGEAVLLATDRRQRVHAARDWAFFGALSVGAALITPFGIEGLVLPFKLAPTSFASTMIMEEMSPDFQQLQPLELWIMALVFAALSLGWRLPPTRVGIVLLLLHMALVHVRYCELLGLVAPLLLAPALTNQLQLRSPRRRITWLDRRLTEFAKPAGLPGMALAGAILLSLSGVMMHGGIARESDTITPAKALAVAAAHRVAGPVFNYYYFGGYLMFAGVKPFIDGRAHAFYSDAFIERYFPAMSVSSNQLPEILAEYGISWTLLPPSSAAAVLLDHLPGWHRLYADDIAVIHVRDQPGMQ